METEKKPLQELIKELLPQSRTRVREYVEFLLAEGGEPVAEPDAPDPGPGARVTLQPVTAETVREICRLTDTLTPPKKFMVAPNALSIAQAYFEPKAWFRAIYADEVPVGFVMLYDNPGEADADSGAETKDNNDNGPEYFLWRFMIAEPHHGKGFGRQAIQHLVEYVKTRPGATVLETSCVQGPGSPECFYRSVGFERSGQMHGDEVGLSLELTTPKGGA
jgi:diamine N-acetyltransferase